MKALFVDVGSNSIRSMTVHFAADGCRFSEKTVYTTRLAQGLDQSGALSNDSMRRSLDVLTVLAAQAEREGCPVYGYATSAVRDAANGGAFVRSILTQTGIPVEVLPPNAEADLALRGATGGTGALLDIGGGSAQLVSPRVSYSAPCGCVRAKDQCPNVCAYDEMQRALLPWLRRTFAPPPFSEACWTGVGGTITTLAAFDLRLDRYDARAVASHTLTEASVLRAYDAILSLGSARRSHPLLSARHDVILPGAAVLLHILRHCGIPALRVSDADGLEGYALRHFSQC